MTPLIFMLAGFALCEIVASSVKSQAIQQKRSQEAASKFREVGHRNNLAFIGRCLAYN
jgi:hypothetical protein